MINPKVISEIVESALRGNGDMLVGACRTYELSMGHVDEEHILRYIKADIARNMSQVLVGRSFIEQSKDDIDHADVFTGRVLVLPYIELKQTIASITAKIIAGLNTHDCYNMGLLERPRLHC